MLELALGGLGAERPESRSRPGGAVREELPFAGRGGVVRDGDVDAHGLKVGQRLLDQVGEAEDAHDQAPMVAAAVFEGLRRLPPLVDRNEDQEPVLALRLPHERHRRGRREAARVAAPEDRLAPRGLRGEVKPERQISFPAGVDVGDREVVLAPGRGDHPPRSRPLGDPIAGRARPPHGRLVPGPPGVRHARDPLQRAHPLPALEDRRHERSELVPAHAIPRGHVPRAQGFDEEQLELDRPLKRGRVILGRVLEVGLDAALLPFPGAGVKESGGPDSGDRHEGHDAVAGQADRGARAVRVSRARHRRLPRPC